MGEVPLAPLTWCGAGRTTGNSTNIRTVSLYTSNVYDNWWQCWAFLFDHAQTKADGYGLTLRFRRALNRVLVNP